jgi:hypothetical protein
MSGALVAMGLMTWLGLSVLLLALCASAQAGDRVLVLAAPAPPRRSRRRLAQRLRGGSAACLATPRGASRTEPGHGVRRSRLAGS